MRHSKPSMLVLSITIAACALSACATQLPPPVVATCPRLPEAPPSLMQPPKASNALQRLEEALRQLEPTANSTPQP